jgi:hypothetical protein
MKPTITPASAGHHLGRAVIALPTQQTLEAATAWHLARFWSGLAKQIPVRFGSRRRTLAHA